MASKPPVAAPKASKRIVAPGRTITQDGKHFGPGDAVMLDEDDAARFEALGFILSPDGTQTAPGTDGPAVNVVDGVQIKPKG